MKTTRAGIQLQASLAPAPEGTKEKPPLGSGRWSRERYTKRLS
jgi:hypothetical protein